MPMFQIPEFVEARLATLTPRNEKHGDDDKPAVSIGVEIETANTILDGIDPTLRPTLWKADDDQPMLPGVDAALTVLRCNSIDRVALPTKHDGWTLAVDDGIDDTKPSLFGGCKVDKFSAEPKQGGRVLLRLRIGTSDLDADRSGMLGMHVGQPIWIKLTAPEKGADAGEQKPAEPDATDLFAGRAPDQQPDGDAVGDDSEGGSPKPPKKPGRGTRAQAPTTVQ